MIIIKNKKEMRAYGLRAADIGFVPTMGYLHAGHMALVRRARAESQHVVVSIFVNPAQFNDAADFAKYPIDFERDIQLLEHEGVDALFLPSVHEIYPDGVPSLQLRYDALMAKLCGKTRPGHFEGMLLIVHNLFMWTNPARAYFGLKDYQQLLLVKKMAHDLELPVEIVACPLVRESDGLAMSSRNARLSGAGKLEALKISRALYHARDKISHNRDNLRDLTSELHARLNPLQIEYAGFYDTLTLEPLDRATQGKSVLAAVAAFVEGVRLIDNMLLEP